MSATPSGTPFRTVPIADDHLHPVPDGAPSSWTETSYFGFNIPDANINGTVYIWYHPVLNCVSGGLMCWQGFKDVALASEYFDWQLWLPHPADNQDYTLPNGLSVTMIEPLRHHRIRFADPARNCSLELDLEAVAPAIGRADGLHFLQPMRTRGELVLRGERHVIDGFFTRDRSFNQPRPEGHSNVPGLGWLTGIFDAGFAFHLCAWDGPDRRPEYANYAVPKPGEHVRFGYVWKGGRIRAIRRAEKETLYERGIMPIGYRLTIEDDAGEVHAITGTVTGRIPWNTWPNLMVYLGMTKWECEGRIGWGDTQEIMHNDYLRGFLKAG